MTRRRLLAGIATALLPTSSLAQPDNATPEATPDTFTWPEPVLLGEDFELVDWRLSLGDGEKRFLAEVRNISTEMVIAPTIGVVLPHLSDTSNYGLGSPFTPVIHPGDSTFVIGLAPAAVQQQGDWDNAEWFVCEPGDVAFDPRRRLEGLDYSVQSTSIVHQPDWIECTMSVTNEGSEPIRYMRLTGIVRDGDGRVCGGTAFSSLANIPGGETLEMKVNVRPNVEMAASPFEFTDDLTNGTVSFSVQPPGGAVNQGCPVVMPWNR